MYNWGIFYTEWKMLMSVTAEGNVNTLTETLSWKVSEKETKLERAMSIVNISELSCMHPAACVWLCSFPAPMRRVWLPWGGVWMNTPAWGTPSWGHSQTSPSSTQTQPRSSSKHQVHTPCTRPTSSPSTPSTDMLLKTKPAHIGGYRVVLHFRWFPALIK